MKSLMLQNGIEKYTDLIGCYIKKSVSSGVRVNEMIIDPITQNLNRKFHYKTDQYGPFATN